MYFNQIVFGNLHVNNRISSSLNKSKSVEGNPLHIEGAERASAYVLTDIQINWLSVRVDVAK